MPLYLNPGGMKLSSDSQNFIVNRNRQLQITASWRDVDDSKLKQWIATASESSFQFIVAIKLKCKQTQVLGLWRKYFFTGTE
jgi:hypothetical protein